MTRPMLYATLAMLLSGCTVPVCYRGDATRCLGPDGRAWWITKHVNRLPATATQPAPEMDSKGDLIPATQPVRDMDHVWYTVQHPDGTVEAWSTDEMGAAIKQGALTPKGHKP